MCNRKEVERGRTGFNRYMVECECRIFTLRRVVSRVLIDTWWNVNQFVRIGMQRNLLF